MVQCKILQVREVPQMFYIRFSEVLPGSTKILPVSNSFFSKVLKRLRRSCKVLQGSKVPFGSIRSENDPQDSTKFEMDLSGSSRFCEALRYSAKLYKVYYGPVRFYKVQKILTRSFSVPTGSQCFHGAPVRTFHGLLKRSVRFWWS